MIRSRPVPGTILFASIVFGMLGACTYPSPTAGGKETNQAILDMGLQQFNHLYGWQGGDPRRIDSPEEINFGFWTAFWKLLPEQQLAVFNSFEWPAVHAFCKYGVDKWEINETGSSLPPEVQQVRYRQIIHLMDLRYALGIGRNTELGGMNFLIRIGGKSNDEGSVDLNQFFYPKGRGSLEQDQSIVCTLFTVYSGKVDVNKKHELVLSKDELRLMQTLFP